MPERRALVDELADHLRALLRDVLCGHLEEDLVAVAEGSWDPSGDRDEPAPEPPEPEPDDEPDVEPEPSPSRRRPSSPTPASCDELEF